jgi:hypothetical protein
VDSLARIFWKLLGAAYFECRYPLLPNPFYEKFPVPGLRDFYEDPVYSSGLHQFCYDFCRLILWELKSMFGIGIPESWVNEKMSGDEGERFGNLFFGSSKQDYISAN